ncbi:hypothetical protein GALMADRAFT_227653 [Galerina marginata CBS 339.88]|uniref:Uncharacterized protein n=1 Tax=Galerina marginata (strain CBS 339.88) TaxID=685588 RepID=A0A067T1Z5_GALM3|nr:hypothetical protein GALMADRAFT_227653 [Galerina marginata CBS 339.88]
MCGEEAAPVVWYVTTTWDEVDVLVGEEREDYFKRELWKQMLTDGASTARFHNTPESAWGIIDDILHKVPVQSVALQLQKELIEFKKTLEDTKAGQALFSIDVVVEQNPEAPQNARELIPKSSKSTLDIEALYLKAIQASASAAQNGFALAADAIAILNGLEDSTTDKAEREERLTALLLLTVDGHKEAKKSFDDFREVRKVVTNLIASGASLKRSRKSEKSMNTANLLEPLLESASKYVSRWNIMDMKQSALTNRCQRLIEIGHGRLYEKAVLGNFTDLKGDYEQYLEEIQNAFPSEPPAEQPEGKALTGSKPEVFAVDSAITEGKTWSFRSLVTFLCG